MGLSAAERSKRYKEKNPEAYRKKKREYAKTPEERAKRTAYMRKWREANREKFNEQARLSHHKNKHKHVQRNRDWHLKTHYSLTQADYDAMLIKQDGCCAICKTDKPSISGQRKFFHIDHNHTTGAVRKLLCVKCNTAYGWFETYRENIINYEVS